MASKQDPCFFVEIARVDEEERMVYGYATTETVDSLGTIVDLESVQKCLPDYLKWRNIREMHQPSAVGRAETVEIGDKGLYIGAKIIDDMAWEKVKERVYNGFSIGGKQDYRVGNRIYLKKISEISLGDRPANEDCTFDTFKIYSEEKEPMNEKAEVKPPGEEQRVATADVTRGMYDVGRFGELLQSLAYLASSAQDESSWEGDASPVPAKLKEAMAPLVEVYKEMAQEEVDELMAGLNKVNGIVALVDQQSDVARTKADTKEEGAAKPDKGDEEESGTKGKASKKKGDEGEEEGEKEVAKNEDGLDVTRVGKRNSRSDAKDLQSIHDACIRLGAACGDVCKTESPDVTRIQGLEADVTRLQSEVDVLRAENETLKAEPAPAKGVTRVVSKENDSTKTEIVDTEITDPTDAIKRIHQSGGVTINRI